MNAFSIRRFLMPVAVICALSCAGAAQVDQEYAPKDVAFEVFYGITASSPIGQSFTPQFTSLDFITISLGGLTPGDASGTLEIDLFAGEGFSGANVGVSAQVQATVLNLTTQEFEFGFTPIALTAGQLYSFRVRQLSGDPLALAAPLGASTTYTTGKAILSGTTSDSTDFRFREGIAVPEPTTALLLIISVAFLLATRTRPNHALQRTALHVTAPASTAAFPPAVQVPRRAPRSLSLGSLGIMARLFLLSGFWLFFFTGVIHAEDNFAPSYRDPKPPADLLATYARFVEAARKGDSDTIKSLLLPGVAEITSTPREPKSREYGTDINLPFLRETSLRPFSHPIARTLRSSLCELVRRLSLLPSSNLLAGAFTSTTTSQSNDA